MLPAIAMRARFVVPLALLALAAPAAAARKPARPLALPAVDGRTIPYVVVVPRDWDVRQVPGGGPGLWIGRPGARPEAEPELLHVLPSAQPFGDPQQVVAAIRAADQAAAAWSAPLVEVREVAGTRGVLMRMETGEGAAARTVLALRLPAGEGSVDFLLSARRADFARLEPLFTTVLTSLRRAEAAAGRGR
ncbi:MAG TPA: hypothetical protein VF121_02015 [Thermoanaerobaculia bacterium]|nr:hypothetical protein [Thermoanaerobaculia bacterium]